MNVKEKFIDNAFDVLERIEVVLVRLPQGEFSSTVAYELFGCVNDIKTAGATFLYSDIVDSLWLMEKVLLSMHSNAIGFDVEMIDCFIEFSNCVSELMSGVFDDETIIDDINDDVLVGCAPRQM